MLKQKAEDSKTAVSDKPYTHRINALVVKLIGLMFLLLSLSTTSQESNNVLNLCVDPDWMPFEGVINGEHSGIASDYLRLFSELTPYSFNIVVTESWKESTEFLKSAQCDLTLLLNSSVERESYLAFTMPYFFGPNVLVSKNHIPFMQDLSAIEDMTLGVVSGYRLLEEIPLYYPGVNIEVVPSEQQGLEAVEKGTIDVYVGSLYSINQIIEQRNFTSLKINGWISIQDKLRIGFTKPNAHLVPIFNQAIDQISTSQHNEILNRWSNTKIIKQTDYTLLYYLAAGASVVFLIFLWRYLVSVKVLTALNSKNQELEKIRQELLVANKNLKHLSFHDSLTDLYNRHYFMSTLNDHIACMLRENSKSAILMIDLDFFKQINDNFGHIVGDRVLQQFAMVLSDVLRASDVAARWGGEEFIVLLSNASKNESLSFAKRLIKAVEQYDFESSIHLTISIGISQFKPKDSIESWIERADAALYQAKNEGRNRVKELS